MLKILRRGAGVVLQPGQRKIRARPVEQGQWAFIGAGLVPQAIGQFIADLLQFGGGEMPGQFRCGDAFQIQIGRAIEHIGIGDFDFGAANRDHHVIIGHQQAQLLFEIGAEHRRAGDSGGVAAGAIEPGKGADRAQRATFAGEFEAQFRVGPIAAHALAAIRGGAIVDVGFQRIAQGGDGLGVDVDQLIDDCGGGKIHLRLLPRIAMAFPAP